MKRILLSILMATIISCDVVETKNCIKIKNNTPNNILFLVSRHYPDTFLTKEDISDCDNIVEHIGYSNGDIVKSNDSETLCNLGSHYGNHDYWKREISNGTLMIYFFNLNEIKIKSNYEKSKIKIIYVTFEDFVRNKGVFYFNSTISR